jgi:hypothetical protein
VNETEIKKLLVGANAIDPRVQVNAPTAGLWSRRLMDYPFVQAWAALEIYYDREVQYRPPIDPPELRKIIQAESTRAAAVRSAKAIEAPKAQPAPPWVREWLDGLKKRDKEVLDG